MSPRAKGQGLPRPLTRIDILSAAPRLITRRQVNIDFAAAQARAWNPGFRDIEAMCNCVSYFLPSWERFFARSAAYYQDRITDEQLAADVANFVYQESVHAKEHARCNQRLDDELPEGPRIARIADRLLTFAKIVNPRPTQLAITCALEHFTAIMADAQLRDHAGWSSSTDPAFRALWSWHAAEEIEHKAVCLDLYRHVIGTGPISYLHRVGVMFVTTLVLAGVWLVALRSSGLAADGDHPAGAVGKTASAIGGAFNLGVYFDYYRPGFHPWDHDNRELAMAWRERYPGFGRIADAPA